MLFMLDPFCCIDILWKIVSILNDKTLLHNSIKSRKIQAL